MPRFTLSTFVAIAVLSSKVYAQNTTTSALVPLASKHFPYTDLVRSASRSRSQKQHLTPSFQQPYQADPDNGVRGTQFGYNRCNSTTENQQSLCQTAILNSIDGNFGPPGAAPLSLVAYINLFLDFCLWAPSSGPTTISETEGEEVAWCTKPGHGTRLIPADALQGVQFMRTPDYLQVVGFIRQDLINLEDDDFGGELDPHGADLRGNPLGGLVYSNGWSNGDNSSYEQVIEWHNFMGGSVFCFKVCDPAGPNAANYCQHIYDRIGCAYNAPNNAQNGTFESCEGADQDFPGVYTDASGQVQTYTQPAESLGAISTMPYQPKVPASSNCVTYTSSQIFAALPTASGLTPSSGVSSLRSTGTRTSTGTGPSNTGGSSGSNGSPTNLAISSFTSLFSVALAIFFLS